MSGPFTSSIPAFPLLCADGSPLRGLQRRATRIAASEATVLILGETGTGKGLLARHLHAQSARREGPFVVVNCGAISEAELFGDPSAAPPLKCRLASAEGGTLFLDEIGELAPALQVKLLQALQERGAAPSGEAEAAPVGFRLLAATHRDLAKEVDAGRFRADLYYRLLVCPVKLPALRDRPEDILPLFRQFWASRGELRPVEAEALAHLRHHAWPGNVRELENLVERLSVCCEAERVSVEDLEANLEVASPLSRSPPQSGPASVSPLPSQPPAGSSARAPSFPIDLPTLIRDLEERYLTAALDQTGGNRRAAAELLGLQRTTLVEKLRRRTHRLDGGAPLELKAGLEALDR